LEFNTALMRSTARNDVRRARAAGFAWSTLHSPGASRRPEGSRLPRTSAPACSNTSLLRKRGRGTPRVPRRSSGIPLGSSTEPRHRPGSTDWADRPDLAIKPPSWRGRR